MVLTKYVQSLCLQPQRFAAIADRLRRSQRTTIDEIILLRDGGELQLEYIPLFRGKERSGQLWTYRDGSATEPQDNA